MKLLIKKCWHSFRQPIPLNKNLKILLYGSNLWSLGEGMLGPIFGVFTERIGGNILDISWIWATYMIATGIFTICVGNIADEKISKEKLMVAGYAINTIFTFSYLLVSSSLQLLFVQVGLGFATALATPTWDALYTNYYEDKTKAGYLWGIAVGRDQVITGIGIVIGGLIVNYCSFKVLFVTMGIVQAIATIYQAQILKPQL